MSRYGQNFLTPHALLVDGRFPLTAQAVMVWWSVAKVSWWCSAIKFGIEVLQDNQDSIDACPHLSIAFI